MQVKHLIELLQALPPETHLVLHDVYERDFFSVTELSTQHLKPCEIFYPHFDRAPKIAKPDTPSHKRIPAIFVSAAELPR